jgi:serine/threonine protein kinase
MMMLYINIHPPIFFLDDAMREKNLIFAFFNHSLTKMIIGRGTYGTIYDDGDGNATKRMNYEEGIPYCILREVSTMSLLQNCEQIPKIVKIKMGCDDIGITMKKYKMNLLQYRCEFKLTLFEIKKILYQILLGLHHGEKFGILHRDTKPDNIFMDSPDVVVVGDWGLSRLQDTKDDGSFSNLVQTKWYRAPEIVEISDDRNKDSVHNYNNIVDVWSVGCIMYELLFNRFFCETDDKLPASEHLKVIHSKILELDNDVPHTEVSAAILLKNMLEIDPNQRFTISQCLSDAFFADWFSFPSREFFFCRFCSRTKDS